MLALPATVLAISGPRTLREYWPHIDRQRDFAAQPRLRLFSLRGSGNCRFPGLDSSGYSLLATNRCAVVNLSFIVPMMPKPLS